MPSPNQTLHVVDGSSRVAGDLVFRGITDKTLVLGESDKRRSYAVSLVVCDDFHIAVLVITNTRIRCAQVDANHCVRLPLFSTPPDSK